MHDSSIHDESLINLSVGYIRLCDGCSRISSSIPIQIPMGNSKISHMGFLDLRCFKSPSNFVSSDEIVGTEVLWAMARYLIVLTGSVK